MNNTYRAVPLQATALQNFNKTEFKMPQKKTIAFLIFLSMLFFALYCSTCIAGSKDKNKIGLFKKTIIWDAEENSVDGYRIPGIVVTSKGTMLAFSEERPVYGDADPKSIVVKRSEDKGETWSQNIYIENCNGEYWSEYSGKIDKYDVTDKKEVWTNPAPLVDMQTGRIFIFYALSEGLVNGENLQRYTKVFYKYSDDEGLNWSDRFEITDILNSSEDGSPNKDETGNWIIDVNGFPCDYLGRAFHMPGPGHGIQLSNGRLLLQVWNRTALGTFEKGENSVDERKYGICTIYSDDHGDTWKYGSSFAHNGLNGSESRIVELENGDIYLNTRYVKERNSRRMIAYSYDKGITWTDIKIDNNFPLSNSCDAGLINIKNNDDNKNLILYSKNESTEGRKNLVVKLSYDEGQSWAVAKMIDGGWVSYSDLAVLPDGTFILVYETGKQRPVYCVRFNLSWLISEN